MFKFLVKLALLVMGIYIFFQIPLFQSYGESIKNSFYEKVGNVIAEVDRIRGKVDDTKEKIDETKEAVVSATNKVKETKESVEGVLTKVNKAVDAVDSAFTDDQESDTSETETEQ